MGWVRQGFVPIRGIWSDRPVVDWIVVAAVMGTYWLGRRQEWIDFAIWQLSNADRMRLYVAIATVSSLLFGFATASIAFFYGSAKGDRLDLLKKVLNEQVVRTWRASLSAPLLAVAVALVAMVGDTAARGAVWVGVVVTATLIFLGLRAFRLRWMFVTTLNLMTADLKNPSATVDTPTGAPPAARERPAPRHSATVPLS